MNKNTLIVPAIKFFAVSLLLTMVPFGIYQIQIAFTYWNKLSKPIIFIMLFSIIFTIILLLKKTNMFLFGNEKPDNLRVKHIYETGLLIIGVYFAFTAFTSFISKILGSLIYKHSIFNSFDFIYMTLREYLFSPSLYQLVIAICILYRAKKVLPSFKSFKSEAVKTK